MNKTKDEEIAERVSKGYLIGPNPNEELEEEYSEEIEELKRRWNEET